MATAAAVLRSAVPEARRKSFFTGTPEIYFGKAIDNSRLVKMEDPRRNREMKQFGTALAVLFMLVFTYAWQHFRAIEYGYQIESSKRELGNLTETNRALRLEDASLRDPERIDVMARRMWVGACWSRGQVIRMVMAAALRDTVSGPVMAEAWSRLRWFCRTIARQRGNQPSFARRTRRQWRKRLSLQESNGGPP